MLGFEE